MHNKMAPNRQRYARLPPPHTQTGRGRAGHSDGAGLPTIRSTAATRAVENERHRGCDAVDGGWVPVQSSCLERRAPRHPHCRQARGAGRVAVRPPPVRVAVHREKKRSARKVSCWPRWDWRTATNGPMPMAHGSRLKHPKLTGHEHHSETIGRLTHARCQLSQSMASC